MKYNGKEYYSQGDIYNAIIEENRKLKEERDFFKEQAILWRKDYKNEYEGKRKLEEENAELKSELSKFSDSFKRYRDYEKEELAESCYDLARENEKLKEEIGKLVMNGK